MVQMTPKPVFCLQKVSRHFKVCTFIKRRGKYRLALHPETLLTPFQSTVQNVEEFTDGIKKHHHIQRGEIRYLPYYQWGEAGCLASKFRLMCKQGCCTTRCRLLIVSPLCGPSSNDMGCKNGFTSRKGMSCSGCIVLTSCSADVFEFQMSISLRNKTVKLNSAFRPKNGKVRQLQEDAAY
ncbi:hypothetical protein Anapl_06592 [Anas platyrhynchos]|uniref:Uncharacterized protein n=1 Tax=Anas platyrhynchos TaxID=8839 RepID=R0LYC9_ANAPL|nr:hypothetical protein Anapl_06592 [Anas platyrhynchos]